jgi:TonB family protein
MIPPLRGIADTYRLEFIYGPELSAEQQASNAGSSGLGATMGTTPMVQEYNPAGQKLDPAGETALRGALAICEAASPNVDTALHVAILLDLGDWLMLDAEKQAAMDTYRRAWPLLKDLSPPDNASLDAPAQIMYRLPAAANRSQRAKPENIVEGFVDVEFTVTADGHVTGERTIDKSASDIQERSVLNAVRKARYRPRFEAGQPVETRAVRLHQQVYSVKSSKS